MKKIAYIGGGCFWGMEHYLKQLDGVIGTSVGFMGGDNSQSTYEHVKMGRTGHAEIVEVKYDSDSLSFEDLMIFFFRLHDPTTVNRQHNDVGTQYRSAVFTSDIDEINSLKSVIKKLDDAKVFESKIVTTIEPSDIYHKASEFHQDYLLKYPSGYNCHSLRGEFKI